MIIEFTGIPGSGKSTIIERLKMHFNNDNIILDVNIYLISNLLIPIRSVLILEIVIFSKLLKLKREDLMNLYIILKIIKSSKNNMFHKINIFRNIIKKFIIYRTLSLKSEIFIVDEGISHIILSLFVDFGMKTDTSNALSLLLKLPKPDLVFLIDVDDETLFQRVVKRGSQGHRRMKFNHETVIKDFITKSRLMIDIIRNNMNVKEYKNISKDIDLEMIVYLIGLKNV